MIDVAAARTFLTGHGRVLEQRLAAVLFDGASPDGVERAVAAYLTDGGGLGFGLEPDTRCPTAQPLYAQVGLEALVAAGCAPPGWVDGLCDWLTAIGPAVPILFTDVRAHPHAPHWGGDHEFPAALNPTAAIAAALHDLGVAHPWRDAATAWCLGAIESDGAPADAHTLRCVFSLLTALGDDPRASALRDPCGRALFTAEWFKADAASDGYGQPPPAFAPAPDSPWRALFDDDSFEAHLDALEAAQQADGGWPISWESASPAATFEWRGTATLDALRVLKAYGRW